jgi:hypothetical protein
MLAAILSGSLSLRHGNDAGVFVHVEPLMGARYARGQAYMRREPPGLPSTNSRLTRAIGVIPLS